MDQIDIAGLKINALSKKELLDVLVQRIKSGQKTWVTTPYSEFLYAGLKDTMVLEMLNGADIAMPDGIGMFWAKKFLEIPLTAKSYWGKILQALWQIKYSLAAIIFYPSWIKSTLPEKIAGSDLIWDLAKLASEQNLSIYLLGGFGNTPEKVANQLISKSVNQLKIAGYSNKNAGDPTIIADIKNASPDILLVAYGPIKQEQWIARNLPNLPVKLAIGLGGTFDYLAGNVSSPPRFLRQTGLEWLYRLFTQPHRLFRICNATFGLINLLIHYKVFNSYGMRNNAVGVILNNKGRIFLGKKRSTRVDIIDNKDPEKWKNYWQFPQGGIEDNEDLITAVKREVTEETGIKDLKYLHTSAHTHSYVWNNALRKFWKNKTYLFKGQTQKIVYFKILDANQEINLPSNEEFVDYQWAAPNELDKIVHKERLNLIKIVQEDLKNLA